MFEWLAPFFRDGGAGAAGAAGERGSSKKRRKGEGGGIRGSVVGFSPPAQPSPRQQQQSHQALDARVVDATTSTAAAAEMGRDGGEAAAGTRKLDAVSADTDAPLPPPRAPPPPPPPPRWPAPAAAATRPQIRPPVLGGDIFGPVRSMSGRKAEGEQQQDRSFRSNNNHRPSSYAAAAAGAGGALPHNHRRRTHGPHSGGGIGVVLGPATPGTTKAAAAEIWRGRGLGPSLGLGARSAWGPPRPPATTHQLASERAALVVTAASSSARGPGSNGGARGEGAPPPPPPPPLPPPRRGGGGGGGGGGQGDDALVTREQAFAQGMRGGRPGSGNPPRRPDLEQLRRVAEFSLGGGGGRKEDDDDGNNNFGSLVPYSSDSAPSPRHDLLPYSTAAEEKAAYAAKIREVAASTREVAAGKFAEVSELFDSVNLSSSSSSSSSASSSLPRSSAAPAATPPPSGLHHFQPQRPHPWIDASMAAASAEALRLHSLLHRESEARRMLSVRSGIREAKERESSLAELEEREKEIRAAKAAVGRAAARAEKEAAERGAAAKKEASARARAEAKAAKAAAEATAKKAAVAAGDGEILLLSDSDEEDEKPTPKPTSKPKGKPAADDDDGAVLLLSSSDDDDGEGGEARQGGEDLSSVFESGLGLSRDEKDEEDEKSENEEDSTVVDASALASMAVAAGLPSSTASALSRLTRRQRRAALAALSPRLPNNDVVAVQPRTGVPLPRAEASSLVGRSWLNDEVMNMCLDGLQDRDIAWRRKRKVRRKDEDGKGKGAAPPDGPDASALPPRAHFFSTFFLAKLYSPKRGDQAAYDYQGVRRWTGPARLSSIYCCPRSGKQEAEVSARVLAARAAAGVASSSSSSSSSKSKPTFFSTSPPPRLDAPPPCLLTSCDLLIFPLHLGVHWATASIDLSSKRIDYLDSMGGYPARHLRALQRWLGDEAADKLPSLSPRDNPRRLTPEDFKDWPVRCLDPSIVPQQDNGSDCGVFALRFAESLGRGVRVPDFSQSDMEALRLVVAADLVMGTVSATPKRRR